MLIAEDRAALEAELASLPANAGGSMQWETYAPAAGDEARVNARLDTLASGTLPPAPPSYASNGSTEPAGSASTTSN